MEKLTERQELTWIVVFRISCVAGICSCLFLLYGLWQLFAYWHDDVACPYYGRMLICGTFCGWCANEAVRSMLKDLR